jgi:hypothetical protein
LNEVLNLYLWTRFAFGGYDFVYVDDCIEAFQLALYFNRKCKDEAIRKGYLHPREYASLRFNDRNKTYPELFLQPSKKVPADTAMVNARRKALLLPDYETDSIKHAFHHERNLQLSFGMFRSTR